MSALVPLAGAVYLLLGLAQALPPVRRAALAAGRADAAGLAGEGLGVLAAVVFVRQLGQWDPSTMPIWWAFAALAVAAVAALVVRAAELPLLAPRRPRWRSALRAAAGVVLPGAVLALLLG